MRNLPYLPGPISSLARAALPDMGSRFIDVAMPSIYFGPNSSMGVSNISSVLFMKRKDGSTPYSVFGFLSASGIEDAKYRKLEKILREGERIKEETQSKISLMWENLEKESANRRAEKEKLKRFYEMEELDGQCDQSIQCLKQIWGM